VEHGRYREQVEGLDDRQVPPELGSLAEDYTNPGDVLTTFPLGHQLIDCALTGGWIQNPGENLDRRGLACTIRPDISDQLALRDTEIDP
tara:strand:+ start:638 stop:904 length:267 start_codon:yes stop_codon:yes gene_type:complete